MKINKKEPCIYIISNTFGNVIYIGVTSDLWNRKWKDELIDTMNIERIDLAKDWYSEKDIIEYNQSRKYFI